MTDDLNLQQDAPDLDIPQFLRRNQPVKEYPMAQPKFVADQPEEITHSQAAEAHTPPIVTTPVEGTDEGMTLEQIMERIKNMTTQRDKLTEAISKHKKAAQRIIGSM